MWCDTFQTWSLKKNWGASHCPYVTMQVPSFSFPNKSAHLKCKKEFWFTYLSPVFLVSAVLSLTVLHEYIRFLRHLTTTNMYNQWLVQYHLELKSLFFLMLQLSDHWKLFVLSTYSFLPIKCLLDSLRTLFFSQTWNPLLSRSH